jgi:pimeloyl-ACP methyl ester carboxylesterase
MRPTIALLLTLLACEKHPTPKIHADLPARETAAPSAAPPPPPPLATEPPPPPAAVVQIDVPRDSRASVVRGAHTHIAFMPGLCSNAYAYMLDFPEAARAHGGVVAIEGDQPCEGAAGFRSFTWSATLQRARVEAAFSAAGVPIPKEGITLVGYSAGASIAELMHARFPALFPKLVLIAPPVAPNIDHLKKAHGVVAMSCSLDVPYLMKAAVRSLDKVNVPATYLEMPKCTHGMLADAEHVFGDAFDWLDARGA